MNIESTSCDQRGIVIVFGRKKSCIQTSNGSYSYELRTTNYELRTLRFDCLEDLCVFITSVPVTKLFAGGEGDSGGHVLRETTCVD